MTVDNNFFRFWAKTSHENNSLPNAYHPLICHMIDVACAAEMMWQEVLPDVTKRRLAKPFGLENDLETAGRYIAFLIGLHDLGKCSPPFQLRGKNEFPDGQTRRIYNSFADSPYFSKQFVKSFEAPHGFVTVCELPDILTEHYGLPKRLAKNLAEIIGGHHGIFADSGILQAIRKLPKTHSGDGVWADARRELTAKLVELFSVENISINAADNALDNATAMVFAGFTTVADWVGSNTDFFPAAIDDPSSAAEIDLAEYTAASFEKVKKALHEIGWTRWPKEQVHKTFAELFPFIGDYLRDLQARGIAVAEQMTSPVRFCLRPSELRQ